MNADERRERRTWRFALALAAVAGCVDLICYFTLYHIFTAHMSGNTVAAAAGFETHDLSEAILHALPILCFIAGVAAGVTIGEAERRRGRASRFAPTLILEATALLIFAAIAVRLPPAIPHPFSGFVAVAVAVPVLAMGLQNSTLRRIGKESVRTTFVTGMLVDFAEHAAKALFDPEARKPALISGSVWVAYVLGAAIGGELRLSVGPISIILPASILVVLAAAEALSTGVRAPRRSDGG